MDTIFLIPIINAFFKFIIFAFFVLVAVFIFIVLFKTWFKGRIGEISVDLALYDHLKSPDYHIFSDIILPAKDGTTQIDHIVVSCFGVFVIETKSMSGWIFGSANDETWTQKFPKESWKFYNPLLQNYKHVKTLQTLLHIDNDQIHSIVVFVGDCELKTEMPPNVVKGRENCIKFILSKNKKVLSENQMSAIIQTIEKARLDSSLGNKLQHIQNLNKKKKKQYISKLYFILTVTIMALMFAFVMLVNFSGAGYEQYLKAGDYYWSHGNYERAIFCYSNAIQIKPEAEIFNKRGLCYLNKGSAGKAIEDFKRAIEIDPHNTCFYYNLGVAFEKQGQYEEAVKYLTKAVELTPDNKDAYLHLGMVYKEKGDHIKAIENITKAIEFYPDKSDLYYVRGEIYEKIGQYGGAIHDFSKAISINPKFENAYKERGIIYYSHFANYDAAIRDFTSIIEINPKAAYAFKNRAYAETAKGDYSKAIQDFENYLRLIPLATDSKEIRETINRLKKSDPSGSL